MINLRFNFDSMIKIIYSCMIFITFMIPQETSAKETVNDSNEKLLEYKIQNIEKQINELASANKILSSSTQSLSGKVESISTDITNNHGLYDKVLETTKDSYSFLREFMFYLMSGISLFIAVIFYIFNSRIPKWIEERIDQQLNKMSEDGFSSYIEKWMITENKNLKTKLEQLKSTYSISPAKHIISDEFSVITNKEYLHKDKDAAYNIEI